MCDSETFWCTTCPSTFAAMMVAFFSSVAVDVVRFTRLVFLDGWSLWVRGVRLPLSAILPDGGEKLNQKGAL